MLTIHGVTGVESEPFEQEEDYRTACRIADELPEFGYDRGYVTDERGTLVYPIPSEAL